MTTAVHTGVDAHRLSLASGYRCLPVLTATMENRSLGFHRSLPPTTTDPPRETDLKALPRVSVGIC